MKRSIFAFAAIIAVLTMSFTVASHKGAFKIAKFSPANCYSSLSYADPSTCSFVTAVGATCGIVVAGDPVASLGAPTRTDCIPFSNVFCCATLVVSTKLCPAQVPIPSFTDANGALQTNKFAKIAAVWCKAN